MLQSVFLLQLLVGANSLRVKRAMTESQSKIIVDSLQTSNPKQVALVVIADTHHIEIQKGHIKSIKCYAEKQQYDFYVIDTVNPACKHKEFFFKKHCLVKEFLKTKPEGYQLLVLDGDVHVGVMDRSLDQWLNDKMDVQLYYRDALDEIMAGNYMVRNTPFGLKFLEDWSNYNKQKPPGFASDDNGAIHPLVVNMLLDAGEIPEGLVADAKACTTKYHGLDQDVNMALKQPEEGGKYWDFSITCLRALGQPREWEVNSPNGPSGNIAIWPRLSFWVADFGYLEHWFNKDVGPIMHHGVKDEAKMLEWTYSDIDKCQLSDVSQVSAEKLGHQAWNCANGYGQEAEKQGKQWYVLGKGCPQCLDDCMSTFTCKPLKHCEVPTKDGGAVAGPVPATCPK